MSRFYWKTWLPFCVKNSAVIIADSENTKRDIMRFLKVPEKRIKVVYLAPDETFKPLMPTMQHKETLNKFNIYTKYILNVNSIEPRKNVYNLIVAFKEYLDISKRDDLSLVIVGKAELDYHRCCRLIDELHLEHKVIWCGFVPQEDLPIVYNCAEVFVYLSSYEGFGLPVVEAMRCGVPVICSRASFLPEVCGDAALFVDPLDTKSVSFAIKKVLEDTIARAGLSKKSLRQAQRFSWNKVAQETMGVYREALGKS